MTQTILIIEDEAQTRRVFLSSLSFEGFSALEASCGWEGVKLAQTHHPDLIVCDIMMPDMDGYQVLTELRQSADTAGIPFIFLTAKATMAELRVGMNLGADDYLTKPCTVGQFLDAIATRLQRHANFQQQSLEATPPTRIFPDCPRLNPIFQFIEDHYQQPIQLQDVAQVVGYSPAYLTSLVNNQTGRSVKQWIIERRMVQGRQLLSDTDASIKQIASKIGYTDAGYFIRQFRRIHGVSPQAWRQSQK
ncbi:response regulator [Acaryochloris sp. CCMEE 5410]|uniref:response regulator transcription factor n=1 Tax=Acaryochloris sp. CCMEE 5410 TaxID=310037 RepID=UPI0002483F14|nr:response regulator [Acaryochloris sp. CCMEE 5410]KAI9133019.1 response regulator [Acaryochloris sp. CCMEE 5410]